MSREDIVIAKKPELIVCSIDYDRCLSSYTLGDCSGNMIKHLCDLLIQHPQANLVLMIGSARQSIISDVYHERVNQNMSCWLYFDSFLKKFQSSYPDLSDRISLDPFVLADIFYDKNPGYHFNLRVNEFSETLLRDYDRRAITFTHQHGRDISWQDLTKKSLIYAQLHYVGIKYPGKKIAFHFYDDWDEVVNALRKCYRSRAALIPSHFSLHIFNYIEGCFVDNASDVVGLGFVDPHYSRNVKKFNVPGGLDLHHENIRVKCFIAALKNNDHERAATFMSALLSVNLGEQSRNDITLVLLSHKKYDWLSRLYPADAFYRALIEWCRSTQRDGFTKLTLRTLLNAISSHYTKLSLWMDLNRFCYHLHALPGDEFSEEAFVVLSVIVLEYVNSSRYFLEKLLCTVISPLLSIASSVRANYPPEAIVRKYLYADTADYHTVAQKIIIEKIQARCTNIMNNDLLSAYRALRFVILSLSLSPENAGEILNNAIRYWKNAPSAVPGKTHLALLTECDHATLQETTPSDQSCWQSFFCRFFTDPVFLHVTFVDALPKMTVSNTNVNRPAAYQQYGTMRS